MARTCRDVQTVDVRRSAGPTNSRAIRSVFVYKIHSSKELLETIYRISKLARNSPVYCKLRFVRKLTTSELGGHGESCCTTIKMGRGLSIIRICYDSHRSFTETACFSVGILLNTLHAKGMVAVVVEEQVDEDQRPMSTPTNSTKLWG